MVGVSVAAAMQGNVLTFLPSRRFAPFIFYLFERGVRKNSSIISVGGLIDGNGANKCELFTIFSTKNGENQADALTFLLLLNARHCNELFESDEAKNGGIIIVDGCERGIVGGEILALAAAVKMDNAFANRGRV
jgi:hypothetical protein